MAAISTLTEDWSGGINAGIWNNWGGSPYVTASGGDLLLTNNPASTNFYGLSTVDAYDWTNDSCSVNIKTLPPLDNANDPEYSAGVLVAEIDTNNRYYWSHEGTDVLVAMKVTAGAYAWQGQINSFSSGSVENVTHVRIRFDTTTCYWEYSQNDGASWLECAQEPITGVAITALNLSIANGNWATVAGTYNVVLGDVNILPTPVVSDTDNMFLMF